MYESFSSLLDYMHKFFIVIILYCHHVQYHDFFLSLSSSCAASSSSMTSFCHRRVQHLLVHRESPDSAEEFFDGNFPREYEY